MRKNIFLLAALFALPAFGEGGSKLSKDDQDALANTQALLSDQAALKEFAKDNKDATNALGQVNALTGGNPQQAAQINDMSSSIFTDMVKSTNGDSVAIQEKLQNALKDPAAFMKSLSPEQQAKIHALGAQIDKQNAEARAPSAAVTK